MDLQREVQIPAVRVPGWRGWRLSQTVNVKFSATRDLWAAALLHYDIFAIQGTIREGFFGKRRRILRLFHKLDGPFGPFPGVHAEQARSWLRYSDCREM